MDSSKKNVNDRNWTSKFSALEAQSPLKCLNNITNPSPTKGLNKIMRNPFNVKRRLILGASPKKQPSTNHQSNINNSNNTNNNNNNNQSISRLLGSDEDANLEPPKKKLATASPMKNDRQQRQERCFNNDWTLKTKLKITFDSRCKNWNDSRSTIHRRNRGSLPMESPSKLNDKSISEEAIKNVATVYQHPYMAWQPLYPRVANELKTTSNNNDSSNPFMLAKHSQVSNMMLKDWCESFKDLVNLLIDGKCPYFYFCADSFNILFLQKPIPGEPKKRHTYAYISPISYGFSKELEKAEIQLKYQESLKRVESNSSTNLSQYNESSQFSFTSQTQTSSLDSKLDNNSSQQPRNASSSSSGIVSDAEDLFEDDSDDDDDEGEENDEESSQYLSLLGWSPKSLKSIKEPVKGFKDGANSNMKAKITTNKPLAYVEGVENIEKLSRFLRSNGKLIIQNVGKFACIPPTLLSPCEFRFSTPQYPDIKLSKSMIDKGKTTIQQSPNDNNSQSQSVFLTPKKVVKRPFAAMTTVSPRTSSPKTPIIGPNFFELKGTILPETYKEIHKLLTSSDNHDHCCSSVALESSLPFGIVDFNL